jgi:hypothetical protein
MRRVLFRNLHILLIAFVLLALAPGVIATIYTGIAYRSQAEQQARTNAFRVMRLFSEFNEQMLRSSRLLLSTLAGVPEIRAGRADAYSSQFFSLLSSHAEFHNICSIGTDGVMQCPVRPVSQQQAGRGNEMLATASRKRDFFVAGHGYDPNKHNALITFGYPLFADSGALAGVLVLQLDLKFWNNLILEAQLPRKSTFVLCNREGTILFRHPDPDQWMGRPIQDTMTKAMASDAESGAFRGTGLDGVERLYTFDKLPLGEDVADLFMRIGVPVSEVYAEANALFLRCMAGIGFLAVLVLVVARVAGKRHILEPVNTLVAAAQGLGIADAALGPKRCQVELVDRGPAAERQALTDERVVEELQERPRDDQVLLDVGLVGPRRLAAPGLDLEARQHQSAVTAALTITRQRAS